MSTGAGSEVMTGDLKRAQAMLKSSGYGGERVIIISPVDSIWLRNGSLVAQDLLKQIGFNVEIQEMDLATYFRRRTITEPVDKGGWSVLLSGVSITDIFDPATHLALRGNGLAGWPGWPTDNVVEDLRTAWIDAVSATEQADLLRKIEAHAFEAVPFVPLGQFFMPSAMRTSVEGMVKAPLAVPWNIYKT